MPRLRMPRPMDVASSLLVSGVRLASGMTVGKIGKRPEKPLELWEFEACPYCRRVREALTMLDLDAHVHPCPKGGKRFRGDLPEGEKVRFPYLRDPNSGAALFESADIVRYLYREYGATDAPTFLVGPLSTRLTGVLATVGRPAHGAFARSSKAPEKPLELWSFEASPYCRIAREALCELEIPYLLHNVGKKSQHRAAFRAMSGRMMVPFLVDPNTDTKMFESADIVRYLESTYGV